MDEGDEKRIRSECIELLREAGCDEGVIRHCKTVADLALKIARLPVHGHDGVDKKLVLKGALLHDIGRSRSHWINHGFVGGEIARELGLEEKVVRIIERHVGAGITAEEAREVGLPEMDFMPEAMEEKIVAHADNLIDHGRKIPIEKVIKDLKDKLGDDHPSLQRMLMLHKEVMGGGV